MKAKATQRDLYQEITDSFIAALESGVAPWVKPWKNGTNLDMSLPFNATTGKNYRGMNTLLLWMAGTKYTNNGWMTFKQAQALGGSVRKGEKGSTIVFWKFITKKNDKGVEETFPMLRHHTVFNVEQIDDIDESKLKTREVTVDADTDAMKLAISVGAKVVIGGNSAFYDSKSDYIGIPEIEHFKDADNHDATLTHELVHWTGHESRMNRQLGNRFGSDAYAMEEMIAELGSSFLCAELGIKLENLQHASYIDHWLKVLKADKRAVMTAAGQAAKAVELLIPTR